MRLPRQLLLQSLYTASLHGKYSRALTFQNLCQAPGSNNSATNSLAAEEKAKKSKATNGARH